MKNHAVTGAFSYSGKYIAKELLDIDKEVITLTNSLHKPNPFGERVKPYPLKFDNYEQLVNTLSNTEVLYNTYWVRFNHSKFNHNEAVENTKVLFQAAKEAGVRKIVHISITNPDKASNLDYFRGKGELEEYLIKLGVSYTILRPTVLFGKEDILINNIAWLIRNLPLFGTFGDGSYKLQPIYVGDLAKLAVMEGMFNQNQIINAIGPETFTYRELIECIMTGIGVHKKLIATPPNLAYWVGQIVGKFKKDIVITKPEIEGLMNNLLYVDDEAKGEIKLSEWVKENSEYLGKNYANELNKRVSKPLLST